MFEGIKILDLTKVFSGPLATRYFSDYGAQVIKIENSSAMDPTRTFPPVAKGWSGYFELLNRGKQNLTLNLKTKGGITSFYKLAQTADVIVENLSPKAKYNLKIDYKSVKKFNPNIIYASLAGLDQKSSRKYFDVIAQAESGLMSLSGYDERPLKIGPAIVDAYSGMSLAFAISSALFYKQKTGKGQEIHLSMLAQALDLVEQNLIEYSVTKVNPTKSGDQDNAIAPFGIFSTQDGYIVLAIGSDILWKKFISLFPNSDLKNKNYINNKMRLANLDNLVGTINQIFVQFDSEKLIKMLEKNDIPAAKIKSISEVYSNPWYYKHGFLVRKKGEVSYTTVGKLIKFSEDTKWS